jgi:hypothetical protein
VGSLIQPSMGMALSECVLMGCRERGGIWEWLTFVENIAHGAVVENHDFAEVGLDLGEVFDVCAIAERAVLAVVSSCKVLALHLEPVDDGVGVFLHRRGEDDEVVPLGYLVELAGI